MEKKKRNNILKHIVKILVSAGAIYFVFQKVPFEDVKKSVLSANIWWLIPAFILFNISKIISAFRLNKFFKAVNCHLSNKYNLRLYFIGMFYNLFLPGGISGDGYKVYLLKRQNKGSVKDLISATIVDRVSGLAALLILVFGLLFFSSLATEIGNYSYLFWVVAMLVLPAFYLGVRLFFKRFLGIFWITNFQAFLVQLSQLLATYFIILSLNIDEQLIDNLVLFLFSSVAAVIPISFGGAGLRELVFAYGENILDITKEVSVAIGFIFFAITFVSSIVGVFLREKEPGK